MEIGLGSTFATDTNVDADAGDVAGADADADTGAMGGLPVMPGLETLAAFSACLEGPSKRVCRRRGGRQRRRPWG